MKRLMYIEPKGGGLNGHGRIGWVVYSKSKRSMMYNGKTFKKCVGYKYNCFDVDSGEKYWITGPKKRGGDKLYGGKFEIDDDARVEYWTKVRNCPDSIAMKYAE